MTVLHSYLAGLQRFGIQPGLERIHALLERVRNPHLRYPIALVGGTNGKGSTCEFLAHLLAEEGLRVGLYTSPHLYRWNERIRVLEGQPHGSQISSNRQRSAAGENTSSDNLFPGAISDSQLDLLFADALPHLEAVAAELGQPTEFETVTFLGLWHFARTQVDVAVVEVGLGGKWDATNVTQPTVSVITHVALDHRDRLGDTVEEIARDKVEIARPGRVLVTAETRPEVLRVFQEFSLARNVRLWPFRAPAWSTDGAAMERCMERLPSGETFPTNVQQPAFQTINVLTAATAKLALDEALGRAVEQRGETIGELHRLSGGLFVPGRAEVLRQKPLCLIDGANNPDGAQRLAAHLRERIGSGSTARRLLLVLGILADKDYAGMVKGFAPLAQVVIATQSNSPRATGADIIAAEARRYCRHVESVTPVPAAVERALQLAEPDDIICVTGSFYTIAEVDREAVAKWSANKDSSPSQSPRSE